MRMPITLLALTLVAAPAFAQLESETPAERRTAEGLPGETGMMAQPKTDAPVDVDAAVRAFATAYAAQDSPRVMVYFNRELSAEVEDWVSSERVVIEGQSREVKNGERTDRAGGVAHAVTLAGVQDRGGLIEIGDRRAAIREAIAMMGDVDVVVVAGKGHEQGQIVGGITHPFDDATEAAEALKDAQ